MTIVERDFIKAILGFTLGGSPRGPRTIAAMLSYKMGSLWQERFIARVKVKSYGRWVEVLDK